MMQLGIEIEFWVVDERGQLCDGSELLDAHERLKPEFIDPLVEVQTAPHAEKDAMREDLRETLVSALKAARNAGKHLVPLGTPMTTASPAATGDRGKLFEEIYGDGVQSAKNCAGTHVHFEKDAVCRQLNVLTALDPAIALVNSSPYYCGERGVNSSRAAAYRGKCGGEFEEFCDLWPYADSVADWRARVDEAFDAFQGIAADRGVDPARVDENFVAEDAVLNPVRLRDAQPTVEWRAPDAALPSQVVDLAFDVRDVVEQTGEKPLEVAENPRQAGVTSDVVHVPSFTALKSLSDAAIRWGLASDRVREYLAAMGFDPSAYDPIANDFGGPGVLRDAEGRDLRLAYADHLQADVATLTTGPSPRLGENNDDLVPSPLQ